MEPLNDFVIVISTPDMNPVVLQTKATYTELDGLIALLKPTGASIEAHELRKELVRSHYPEAQDADC